LTLLTFFKEIVADALIAAWLESEAVLFMFEN